MAFHQEHSKAGWYIIVKVFLFFFFLCCEVQKSLYKWKYWVYRNGQTTAYTLEQEEQIRLGQKKSQHRPEKIICENKTKMKLC